MFTVVWFDDKELMLILYSQVQVNESGHPPPFSAVLCAWKATSVSTTLCRRTLTLIQLLTRQSSITALHAYKLGTAIVFPSSPDTL